MSTSGGDSYNGRTLLLTLRRVITYDGENYRWGFQIEDSEERHQWFKLALDPSQARDLSLASKYIDPLAYPATCDAEKLSADLMTALRQHAERVLHYSITESALVSIPIEYIVCK